MKLTCFETVELSDIGRKRKNNEDSCLRVPERGVYCVADGMGGAVGGDLASKAIVKGLSKAFIETPVEDPENFAGNVRLFRQAANAANKWIREFAEEKVIGQMGSTVVALVFDPNNPKRAVGLHAGDSRLYRYRDGELTLLTADHTAAAALAAQLGRDMSKIPEKFHNELVRAVGLADRVELEKTMVEVVQGDLFLLCSDGLTRMLPEETVSNILKETQGAALDQVAQKLIAGANEAGGKDNVTVVLVRMGDLAGFSDELEPVDLEDPDASGERDSSDGESITMTRSGSTFTADSADFMHGHTPHTEEGGAMHGDTPDTSNLSGPPTPATVQPPPPKSAPEKKPAPEAKSGSGAGKMIAVVLVLLVIGGITYHFLTASKSSKPSGEEQTTQSTAPTAPLVSTEALPPPPPKKEAAPAPPAPTTPPAPTAAATADVLVQSDPAGAEIWVDGQSRGKTPAHLELPGGQTKVILKLAGLADQSATIDATAGRSNQAQVVFAYGGVVIQSAPSGASVLQNGTIVGQTPYTAATLAPGHASWQLQATGCQSTNVSVDVLDHQTQQVSITLQRAKGVLRLTGNLAGVEASVDGAGAGRLPMDVWVDAGVDHTIMAKFKDKEQVRAARATSGKTTVVAFTFTDEPPPARRWTNALLGTVFVEVPGAGVWAAANRITEDQFKRVMGGDTGAAKENEDDGQHYVINLTSSMATDFAAKLTQAAKGAGGLPDDLKNYHYTLPTTNQWMTMFSNSENLGLHMANLKSDKDWCLDNNNWYMAGYVIQGTNFNPLPGYKKINPGSDPKPFAIRLVFAP